MAGATEVFHVWRRGDVGFWECVAGVKGTKMDALRLVETMEARASYEEYEYVMVKGDARPAVELKMRAKWG